MAIFHSHLQIITRGIGKSAVGAAAYRSGDKLTNEYDGETHDYGRKGGIVHTKIFLPEFSPRDYADRNTLWNAVEKIEKQKNAQLAREINVALPIELTMEQNLSLLRRYVTENFVSVGMVADVAVHAPDHGTPNPHAHIMLTMRPFKSDGSWDAKAHKVGGVKICTTDWNEHRKATEWRESWANICNEYLAAGGHDARTATAATDITSALR
jgi:ATP-dependent exoDNAse (exonuclease V) alpha subunit